MSASIAAHVHALGQGDKLAAATALSDLAIETVNRDAIREAGGVGPLLSLVREGTPEQRKWAALALLYLAFGNSVNRDAITEAGGVELVQGQVRKLTEDKLKEALQGLGLRKAGLKGMLTNRLLLATVSAPSELEAAAAPGVPLPPRNPQHVPTAR